MMSLKVWKMKMRLIDDRTTVYNIGVYSNCFFLIQVLDLDYNIIYSNIYYYMFIMLVITLKV